ncbi:MAG: hypothetical protein IKA95_05650 [Clostridia bacterium]|nr:hypothetical protein [Clostridia bacterium]
MKFKMSEKSRKFLEKHIPNYANCSDINDLLDEIDDFIVLKGMHNQDTLTKLGIEAQNVFDDIFDNN